MPKQDLFEGMIHVYTGEGKGKTTASLGLAMRAAGHGYKTCIIQFMKGNVVYGEQEIANKLSNYITIRPMGRECYVQRENLTKGSLAKGPLAKPKVTYWSEPPPASALATDQPEVTPWSEDIKLAQEAIALAREVLVGGEYNIVVLDEINVAIAYGLITEEMVLNLMTERPTHVELILTGRYATPEIVKRADLVTEMVEIKHYYQRGVQSRIGIEK
jgi:cob(I)alamin adenosyltransferase